MKLCPACHLELPATAQVCPRDGTTLPADDGRGTGTQMLYDPLIGELVDGRYKIETRLGEGALSTVYAATHELIEKRVAIKVLKSEFVGDADIVERFLREAKAASRLSHENIVSLSDFGKVASGAPFFVMELLDGRTLSDVLYEGKALAVDEAVRLVTEIGRGLAAAHQHGVVHRDLKPDNIGLVRDADGVDHAKILDFGLAKITQENRKLTRAGQVLGTPEYMSPEQASGGTVDHRSDIFALGILLYRMVTGRVPFSGSTFMEVISKLLSEQPRPPRTVCETPGLTAALEAVILRALARKPADRFPTMDALLEALRRASGLVATTSTASAEAAARDAASTWQDAEPPAMAPPGLEELDQGAAETAVAPARADELALGLGPTETMPTVPEITPPAAMPGVPVIARASSAVAEVTAATDESPGLWSEEHAARRVAHRSARRRSRRRLILLSSLIGVLGVGAGVLLSVLLDDGRRQAPTTPGSASEPTAAPASAPDAQPVARPAPVVPPRPRRPPPPQSVRLVVRSVPAGAQVLLDGKSVGWTPLARTLVGGDRTVQATIVKPGYRAERRAFRLDRDVTLTMRLGRAVALRPRPRPRPRPMPVMRPRGPLGDLKDPFAPMR